MTKERLERIKENVNTRCSIATITGIGLTALDKEELELLDEIERLNKCNNETLNILKDYENDSEANRYAPIKEAIEILEGVTK